MLNFVFWTAPVFRTKGEQGKSFYALLGASLDGGLNSRFTGFVAFGPGHGAMPRPPIVAIHNDSDMTWDIALGGVYIWGARGCWHDYLPEYKTGLSPVLR